LQERTKTDKNSTQYETHENLPQMKGKAMILKQYDQGEVLDVAGLNEITVLIDRSRTEAPSLARTSDGALLCAVPLVFHGKPRGAVKPLPGTSGNSELEN